MEQSYGELFNDQCRVSRVCNSMSVDDRWSTKIARRASRTRIPVTFETSIPNVIGAIYADTRRTLGHYLEYVHLLPEAKDECYADVPRYGYVGR